MSRKIKVYLDSGANIHSCKEEIFTLDELGIDEEEWDLSTDRDKETLVYYIVSEWLEWGWEEL